MATLLANGVWATVEGTWVIDTDHDDKTEIHPITSLLIERPPAPDNRSRLIDFLVFSDDSDNFPDAVFHSGENRKGELRMPVPWNRSLELTSSSKMNGICPIRTTLSRSWSRMASQCLRAPSSQENRLMERAFTMRHSSCRVSLCLPI